MADHVHLLVGLKATHCLADVLRELKKASSVWVHEEIGESFSWQEGDAAFTVSPTARPSVSAATPLASSLFGHSDPVVALRLPPANC